ncbi:response regulator transcription factor [Sphingomonas naphthae]|uniref:Response regulator transcription factor n=1 Tax=Sphingomonas naphthae TaxID=1813468 RepID=A0ABY7TKB5_9SPHN|nr:response regulator transcription factor [Sphingomonas naphthae]WCT73388.1 response regulator transcription factor [Sphingomonas naphthae]
MTAILLVEDDAAIGGFVGRGLRAEGYRVEWLRSGRRVRAALETGAFAAMILDLGLPDADGNALCRALRAEGLTTPILMLTARAALEDRLEGFRAGTDDYLSKPFAFEELVLRLAALVRRSAGASVPGYANLRLDPQAPGAVVDGVPLSLSRREYDLLAALVRAGGEPVSRERLIADVWGDGEASDNVVDVYVGYLRRRLATLPTAPRIATVRGHGYRITPKDETA